MAGQAPRQPGPDSPSSWHQGEHVDTSEVSLSRPWWRAQGLAESLFFILQQEPWTPKSRRGHTGRWERQALHFYSGVRGRGRLFSPRCWLLGTLSAQDNDGPVGLSTPTTAHQSFQASHVLGPCVHISQPPFPSEGERRPGERKPLACRHLLRMHEWSEVMRQRGISGSSFCLCE